ncbi:MAG: carboxypeptidase-like regulatory domain-containing protein [Myxococcales bacterium]
MLNAELPAPKGDLAIRGQVLGPDGPVAGAIVVASSDGGEDVLSDLVCQCGNRCGRMLLECGCPEAAVQLVDLVLQRRGEAPPIARTTSAKDGTFQLAGLEDAVFTLWAEQPGKLIGLRRGVRAGTETADVEVGPGMTIHGTAVTDDDKPVAGASVTAIYAEHSRFFDTTSAGDGSFSIGPVPLGKLSVVASAPGLLPGHGRASARDPNVEKLKLFSPRRLAGKALRDGQPIAGAQINLEGQHKKLEARTGADGAFMFSALRPGSYVLTAIAGFAQAHEAAEIKEGKDLLDLLLQLGPGGEIAGVVRGDSGAPITDAVVSAYTGDPSERNPATLIERRTGNDGRYRLTALVAGRYQVVAYATGYAVPKQRTEVEVVAGSAASADFSLAAASPLKGVVVDPTGAPVSEASVRATPVGSASNSDGEVESPTGRASTHRDGSFLVDYLPAGQYEVVVEHDAFRDLKATLTAPTLGARLVLSRGVELTGTVVDEEDKPVAGAKVTARPQQAKSSPFGEDRGVKTQEATNARGEFHITGLDEGPYLVRALLGDYKDLKKALLNVEIHAPATGPIKIKFEAGMSITGRVVGKDGRPVTKAHVFAFAERPKEENLRAEDYDTAYSDAESAKDGSFELKHLKSGRYRVSARVEWSKRVEPLTVQAGTTNLELVLDTGPKARGRVVQQSGEAIARFRVNSTEVRDERGAFEVPLGESEEQYLAFLAEGFAVTSRKVVAKDGHDVELGAVVLTRGRSVTGRVVDTATGTPIAGALVDVDRAELVGHEEMASLSKESGAVVTRADGAFTLPHVEITALGLFASSGRYRPYSQPLGPEENTITVRMVLGTVVKGKVTDAAGKGLEHGMLIAHAAAGAQRVGYVEKGHYRLEGLAPGKLAIEVDPFEERKRFFTQVIDVPESGEVTLDFKETNGGARVMVALQEGLEAALAVGDVPLPNKPEDLAALGVGMPDPRRSGTDVVFEHVAPGQYTLIVLKPMENTLQLARVPVKVGTETEQRIAGPGPDAFTAVDASKWE